MSWMCSPVLAQPGLQDFPRWSHPTSLPIPLVNFLSCSWWSCLVSGFPSSPQPPNALHCTEILTWEFLPLSQAQSLAAFCIHPYSLPSSFRGDLTLHVPSNPAPPAYSHFCTISLLPLCSTLPELWSSSFKPFSAPTLAIIYKEAFPLRWIHTLLNDYHLPFSSPPPYF